MTLRQRTVQDIGPETVDLYACDGKVIPIREFVTENIELLSGPEITLVREEFESLANPGEIPESFKRCMSRSRGIATSQTPLMKAVRSGARSAFISDLALQIKGCRPAINGETFPMEILHPESNRIIRNRIPFGVMSKEAVLREVLGYCFMQRYGLPIQARPLAAISFHFHDRCLGYGMLLELESDDRVEAHLEKPQCTIRELINMHLDTTGKHPGTDCIIGSELRLFGVNVRRYAEDKGNFLAAMHWHGGFRGILNSNIGNDILIDQMSGQQKLALADFDSFCILPLPPNPGKELDRFVLLCLLEVVFGSLPILQYVNLPTPCSLDRKANILGAVYFTKSSLWRTYYRHFLAQAKKRGYNLQAIVETIERMRQTEAFVDVLNSRVLSKDSLYRLENERPFVYSHN